jgi:hypothetical protein
VKDISGLISTLVISLRKFKIKLSINDGKTLGINEKVSSVSKNNTFILEIYKKSQHNNWLFNYLFR